jgi:hypothetical protein
MPSVTLAESAKISTDLVVQGVIESIISVNPLYQLLPFDQISGNALKYTRENTLGDVEFLGVGDTILAKNPATFTQETASLTTLIGDAEVDHFIQTMRSGTNDQKGVQVASKAKNIGRKYQDTMINGDITAITDSFDGFIRLIPVGQKVVTAVNGENLSFAILDQLIDLVTAKDGQVDFFMMSKRTIRAYFALLRALGGAGIGEVVTLPNGTQQAAYRGVPIFPNDWIPTNQVQGTSGANCTTVFAGVFDDGSRTNGVSGLTSENNSGIFVTEVGESETKNEIITRVRFYCGLALFTQKALASAPGILN